MNKYNNEKNNNNNGNKKYPTYLEFKSYIFIVFKPKNVTIAKIKTIFAKKKFRLIIRLIY